MQAQQQSNRYRHKNWHWYLGFFLNTTVEANTVDWRVFKLVEAGVYLLGERPSPFVFVYCRMHFLILGRSVGKTKKKRKYKIGKLSGARRPATSA